MKPLLSPRELADAIGVSESSIKRWVDGGVIAATKTAGGHRRIPINEAVRFLRDRQASLVHPDAIGLGDVASLLDLEAREENPARALFEYLHHGEADAARGHLLSLYLNGRTVAQIVDGPLAYAMEKLGELWHDDEDGIYLEHRATEVAVSAISRLRMIIPPRPDNAPAAVGGAPAGDPYILPSLCAAAVLESQGVNAVNLGADTPIESLVLAAQALKARLVWLSVSVVENHSQLQLELANLSKALSDPPVSVIVGGSRADEIRLPDTPYCHIGESMGELEAMVKGLLAATTAIPR